MYLLIFNKFKAHINSQVIDFAKNYKIIKFCLPSYCTYKCQPLDTTVYRILKKVYSKAISKEKTIVDKERF